MTGRNYYDVLGVTPNVSPAELRRVYVRLVKLHHPDIEGNLPVRLQEVQRAYRCLIDADARTQHDRMIADDEWLHLNRQWRVEQRLRLYERRHPSQRVQDPRRRRWLPFVAFCLTGVVVFGMTLGFLG